MVVVTLEEDGRLELPDDVRIRLGLHPGTRLALEEAGSGRILQLRVLPETVELVEKDGVWVIRRQGGPTGISDEDPVARSREERLVSFGDGA